MRCPSCARDIPAGSRFCPSCGAPQALEDAPTIDAPAAQTPTSGSGRPSDTPSARKSSGTGEQPRFVPGTLLAERYRIVAPLGKGGMGEVYRAEDLKLEQEVALKFLPLSLTQDGAAQARFHREVRVARQVSHANVCRVFDIGEADSFPFLTMEYVDGEDLKSLLRRIGRLPPDKALDIARQLCAGLAAAHEHGVLHRDLKPANIMLDARGKVRITDFGLASLAEEIHHEEIHAGTPAYMAPEQMAGKEVTVRSDIYSLGLVLYEVFTGKHAFDAGVVVNFKQLEQSTPTNPSQIVKDIDPIVERIILRCLEPDPRKRPASALQVAAALPGGDPLAAALAAGETPSPEMVAASGETEGLRPAVAWACLAGIVASAFLSILLSGPTKLYRLVPMEKPPDALAEKSREILQKAGYTETPADTAVGFSSNVEFLRYVRDHDTSRTRWQNLETGALEFWYRSSPRPLEAIVFLGPQSGTVAPDDPPLRDSGMTLVWLTPRGRLTQLVVVPPQVESSPAAASPPNWTPLFEAAGLDMAKWTAATPTWTPPVFSDARAAWTGALPERPEIPVRIEAAAYQGKPVYFQLIGPWTRPERMQPYKPTTGERVAQFIGLAVLLTLVGGGVLLARRNFRMGRGDRRGATRLALFVLGCLGVQWVFGASHVPNFHELGLLVMALSFALFVAGFTWMLYLALEPYVRRRWPAMLISWSRLLAGGFRDPLVGRDLLAGWLVGAFQLVVTRTGWLTASWLGSAPPTPYDGPEQEFLGARVVIAMVANNIVEAIWNGLAYVFLLFLLRLLLRKEWLAGAALVVILTSASALASETPAVTAVASLINNSLLVLLLMRFGLVALVAWSLGGYLLSGLPLTTEVSAWYAGISFGGILLLAALVFHSFYASLGERPMFGGASLED
jgi:serine/threonine-protein kinase